MIKPRNKKVIEKYKPTQEIPIIDGTITPPEAIF